MDVNIIFFWMIEGVQSVVPGLQCTPAIFSPAGILPEGTILFRPMNFLIYFSCKISRYV